MRDPQMQYLAWTGIVKMQSASWGDEAGSTVTFKLPMNTITGGDKSESRNPFHVYTKRRKGKAGTRFFMAVTTSESAPTLIYKDEVMLAGWNDSQLHGHTVKFWICNDIMGHPFEGYSRTQELALALSELDEDNAPIDQKMRDKVEQQKVAPTSRPSYGAVMLCKNPDFHKWIGQSESIQQMLREQEGPTDWEFIAKEWMCRALGIKSRAELNHSEELRVQYHKLIWVPFSATV